MRIQINRRSFLRSTTCGVSTVVGLPLLEAMFKSSSAFADAPNSLPRFFAMYLPNGIIEEKWYPEQIHKTDFDLGSCSLAEFDNLGLKNDISLYRGMTNVCRVDGSSGNAHMVGISSWLTGAAIRNDRSQTHRPSLDQELADTVQARHGVTRVHSLQLAGNSELDRPNNDVYYNPLKNALNWGNNNQLLPLKSDLRNEFDRLYSSNSGNTTSEIDRRTRMKLSVLDDVKQDRENLTRQLGALDRARLEDYFNKLREIEEALIALETDDNGIQCNSDLNRNDIPNPANGSRNRSFGAHARVAAQITAQAFACGLTQAITYAAQGEAAGSHYDDIGIGRHFHNSISHDRNGSYNDHVNIDRFHAELCANFMKEMKDTPHGGGNLLDGTAVLFGSGLGNGDSHQHTDIALLVGGHFGEWQHGRYHNLQDRNHADLIDTLRDQIGLPKIGSSTNVPIR